MLDLTRMQYFHGFCSQHQMRAPQGSSISQQQRTRPFVMEESLFCVCRSPCTDDRCDGCEEWYHGGCLDPEMTDKEAEGVAEYSCIKCFPPLGKRVYKEGYDLTSLTQPNPTSERPLSDKTDKTRRETKKRVFAAAMKDWDVAEEPVSELKWTQLLTQKVFTKSYFMEMKGEELTVEWAKRTGFRHPVLVKVADEGLDLSMPDSSLTVSQVANLVDPDRRVEVLQVSTQSSTTMTLQEWADYYHLPPQQRPRILNVISLEVSETKLGNLVKPPKFVRDIDWTEQVWPKSLKPSHYPKVQMYCLMSVKNSFTDFHIDFGGSSVYYHLVKGRKIFYFVPPTKHNLAKYTDWSSSSNQSTRFFADEVQECVEVVLEEGNTMFIPTGWIHAVFTPIDSIVIGGNFLHGFNIDGQLSINDIEVATNVPNKFRFPHYEQMQWFAAQSYFDRIQRGYFVCKFELNGLAKLAHFLVSLVVSLESLPEDRRARRKEKVIPSSVKDPAIFAQEFRLCITRIVTDRAREQLEKDQEAEEKTKSVRIRISQRDLDEEITNSLFEAGYDPEFVEPKNGNGDSGSDSDFREDGHVKEKEDDFEVNEEPPRIVKAASKTKQRSAVAETLQNTENPKSSSPTLSQNPPSKRLKYVSASLKDVSVGAASKKIEPKKKKGLFSRLSTTIRKLKK